MADRVDRAGAIAVRLADADNHYVFSVSGRDKTRKDREDGMHGYTYRFTWPAAVVIGALFLVPLARAEESDPAALAAALEKVPTTLEHGLQASESTGKPISAKFEIEDGKLQLSVYTMMTNGFNEVVVAPESGKVIKTEKITDDEDLKAATGQKAAMEKTSASLLTATQQALRQNSGSRAVSVYPELQSGHAVAAVTLLRDGRLSKVTETLN